MLCPEAIELEKRCDEARTAYIDYLSSGAWNASVSKPQIAKLRQAAEQRVKLACDALDNHKQECEHCTWPMVSAKKKPDPGI
jgi:hypothetical protein